MYIANGDVAIINSHFSGNIANTGIDISTIPTLIIIGSTFSSSSNAIDGPSPQQCIPDICHDTISSYPQYGIDCKTEPNKNGNYGILTKNSGK